MDCSLPGSSVLGISQARILERAASSFSRESFLQGIGPTSHALAGWLFTTEPSGKPVSTIVPSYLIKLTYYFLVVVNISGQLTSRRLSSMAWVGLFQSVERPYEQNWGFVSWTRSTAVDFSLCIRLPLLFNKKGFKLYIYIIYYIKYS